jgi:hypothetical protein
MDEETRTILRGAYDYLVHYGQSLQEVQIVTYALKNTIRELGPEAEKAFAKHLAAAQQGPIRTVGDEALEPLYVVLRQLNRVN